MKSFFFFSFLSFFSSFRDYDVWFWMLRTRCSFIFLFFIFFHSLFLYSLILLASRDTTASRLFGWNAASWPNGYRAPVTSWSTPAPVSAPPRVSPIFGDYRLPISVKLSKFLIVPVSCPLPLSLHPNSLVSPPSTEDSIWHCITDVIHEESWSMKIKYEMKTCNNAKLLTCNNAFLWNRIFSRYCRIIFLKCIYICFKSFSKPQIILVAFTLKLEQINIRKLNIRKAL